MVIENMRLPINLRITWGNWLATWRSWVSCRFLSHHARS